MIKGFADGETRRLFERERSKALPEELQRKAYQKLVQLHYAESLGDLEVPPGNRLEKLSGGRAGQYSVRVNRQYRVCFVWEQAGGSGEARDVEIVDYHRG